MLGRLSTYCSLLLLGFTCCLMALSWPKHYRSPEVNAAKRAAASCDTIDLKSEGVVSAGDVVCFYAQITQDSKRQFLALQIKDGAVIVLKSGGGDVAAALDLADAIVEKRLSIIVNRYCLSSCANYLFPAAKTKIVLDGGVVGFHGAPRVTDPVTIAGPMLPLQAPAFIEARRRYMEEIQEREAHFFFRIGVNPDLIYDIPLPEHTLLPRTKIVWEFGSMTLKAKYGIRDIIYFETPDHAGLATRVRSMIFGLRCSPFAEDIWLCGSGLLS